MTAKQWLSAMLVVACLIALGVFLSKKHWVNAQASNLLTAPYYEAVGNVIEERGELTPNSVFIVNKCERTSDVNLFDCYITKNNASDHSRWTFSTRNWPQGTKVEIVREHRGGEMNNELPLLERLDEQQLAAIGIK